VNTKKIISFSLWGCNPLYIEGAIRNAKEREEFYPEYRCRFYLDDSIAPSVVRELKKYNCEIMEMQKTSDVLGMYWRFHPMFDDPTIERFLVRDTDSGFSKREVDAVREWEGSGKPFHVIRDCESHQTEILGGTWGCVAGCIPDFDTRMMIWLQNLKPDFRNPRGKFHGSDQVFLSKFIWPLIKDNYVGHIRANMKNLVYSQNDKELPEFIEGTRYVGMVC